MSSSCWVIFKRADSLGFIRKLLHKDISHCFVLFRDGKNWLMYDTTIDTVDICTPSGVSGIISESVAIKVARKDTEGSVFTLNTCVGSVKRFIGMRDKLIFTPYQLYKRLIKWDSLVNLKNQLPQQKKKP